MSFHSLLLLLTSLSLPRYSSSVCANDVCDDRHVKTLVGEIDFSFHVVSTSDDASDESSVDSLMGREKELEEDDVMGAARGR